jgi:hypothetical protein
MRPRRGLPRRSCWLEHNQSHSPFNLSDNPPQPTLQIVILSCLSSLGRPPWRTNGGSACPTLSVMAFHRDCLIKTLINRFVEKPVKDAGNVASFSFFSATCTDCTQLGATSAWLIRSLKHLSRATVSVNKAIGSAPVSRGAQRLLPRPGGACLLRRRRACGGRAGPAELCQCGCGSARRLWLHIRDSRNRWHSWD